MTQVLSLKGVHKQFGGIVVADNITFDIKRGEILGLIGPNGAGKTSLFNLISGVFPVDAGMIFLNGINLNNLPIHDRPRKGVARTWQNIRLFKSLSVLDNIVASSREYPGERLMWSALHPRKLQITDQTLREKALSILARMKLDSLAGAKVLDLPFGQQKLIGLARALMNGGDCLLLDEPMAGVEGHVYETIKDVVRTEAESGRAICVVEHNVSFISDLCNGAVFMNFGKIIERGSVDQLLSSKTLSELYFGA